MFKAIAVAALILATGAPAFAQPRPFYSFPTTADEEQAQELRDQAACTELGADQGRINDGFYAVPTSVGIGGALLVGLVTGVVSGMAEVSRTEHAIRRCMADRGYEALTLAPEKTAELKALKSGA